MSINQDTHSGPSFGWANRLGRVLWSIAWLLLGRWTPPPLHAWRAFLLRCFGAKIGRGVHVYPGARIWAPWNLEIGDQTGIGNGATLYAQGKITLAKRVVISQGAYLCAGTHDYEKPGFPLVTAPIVVGDQAWLAAEVFVHPRVTIGEGAVVGARSVVTKDLPAWMVCSGFPCVPIKPRRLSQSE
jgi:putative colanic acid biosynthesis acetyltransferase WcaF